MKVNKKRLLKKTKRINLRVTAAEMKEFKTSAAIMGMTVAKYARMRLFTR